MANQVENGLDIFNQILKQIQDANKPVASLPAPTAAPIPTEDSKPASTPVQTPVASAAPAPPKNQLFSVTDNIANMGQLLPTAAIDPSAGTNSMKTGIKNIQAMLNSLGAQSSQTAVDAQTASTNSATAAKKSGGSNILGDIIGAATSLIGWVICTELMKQGRLNPRWWVVGARTFAAYPEAVKRGYYLWAIPSVKHLRAHPNSLYSNFLCLIFCWRAENLAHFAGVNGARKLVRGALVTAILWPVCWVLGKTVATKELNWKGLYNGII